MDRLIRDIEESVIGGSDISFAQAEALTTVPIEKIGSLTAAADNIRHHFRANEIDLCSIINARSGRCAEDCKFCAQSSSYKTYAIEYPMKSVPEILAAAHAAESTGARRFCIVTSGESLNERDFNVVLEAVAKIKAATDLKRCASIGRLTPGRSADLREAGLNRYHHNIETAPSFFENVCTTHTFVEKTGTIANVREAGIETCVGGILNLGESPTQRLEFAFALKELDPISVPVNFLSPRAGTPLADRPPMPSREAAKYLAIFRFILPRAFIRLAGGRAETFKDDLQLAFSSGINALLIGNLLTTNGPSVDADLQALSAMGFDVDADSEKSS